MPVGDAALWNNQTRLIFAPSGWAQNRADDWFSLFQPQIPPCMFHFLVSKHLFCSYGTISGPVTCRQPRLNFGLPVQSPASGWLTLARPRKAVLSGTIAPFNGPPGRPLVIHASPRKASTPKCLASVIRRRTGHLGGAACGESTNAATTGLVQSVVVTLSGRSPLLPK